MDRIQVALPWNNSRYIPCNGFHPLYRALFEGDSCIQYNVIDEIAFARALQERRTVSEIDASIARMEVPYASILDSYPIAREFVDHLTLNEFWLTREIPGDIEFHHTSPLSAGTRPFIVHCESFLPLFMPFAFQGRGFMRPVRQIRAFYERVLSSRNCLGIFSHLPETLAQIRGFFRNPKIDSKLFPSRIGLPDHVFKEMDDHRTRKDADCPTFLFTSSANQNSNAFELRGGMVALKFAERYLRSGRDGRFIFRVMRPSDNYFTNAGVDIEFLRKEEDSRILWLGGYLREQEQLRLFACADVMLLPGVNLHSVTLMQAMAAGAIPVVTDTHGPDRFVDDGETGIILKGVRSAVWEEDPECGVPIDRHDHFPSLVPMLAEQLFGRLTPILDNRALLAGIQAKCRLKAVREYSGAAFREQFECDVSKFWSNFISGQASESLMKPGGYFQERNLLLDSKVLPELFEGPPHPVLLANTGSCHVYRLKNVYFSIGRGMQHRNSGYSPLGLVQNKILRHGAITMAGALGDLHSELFHKISGLVAVEAWAIERLRSYPILYSTATHIYRAAARVRRLFQPPLRDLGQPKVVAIRRSLVNLIRPIPYALETARWIIRMVRESRYYARKSFGLDRMLFLSIRFPLTLVRLLYWFGLNCWRELRDSRLNNSDAIRRQIQRGNKFNLR